MSYETNAIAKRLKIIKGWKNPHFPTKTLNYARDLLVWFKIYLFIKVYFSLHEIRLLACEIRWSENHTKILYLAVSKEFHKKKKSRSKGERNSILHNLKSPLTTIRNKNARFSLYQDLQFVKKNSPLILNTWQKIILSNVWRSKPRFTSWINVSLNTYWIRKTNTLSYKSFLLEKYRLRKSMTTNLQKQTLISLPFFPTGARRTLLTKNVYLHKQKQLLSFIVKIKKQLLFLKQSLQGLHLFQQQNNQLQISRTSFFYNFQHETLISYLKFKIENKKKVLNRISLLYKSLNQFNKRAISKIYTKRNKKRRENLRRFSHYLKKRVGKIKLKAFWNQVKVHFSRFKIQSRVLYTNPQLIWFAQSHLYKKTHNYSILFTENFFLKNVLFCVSFLYKSRLKNQLTLTTKRDKNYRTLYKEIRDYRRYSRKHSPKKEIFSPHGSKRLTTLTGLTFKSRCQFLFKRLLQYESIFLPSLRLLEKGTRIYPSQLVRLGRVNQKRKKAKKEQYLWKITDKPLHFLKKSKRVKRLNQRIKLKRHAQRKYLTNEKFLQYRRNYRHFYKNHLALMTNLQLKYHIQDFIQKYFGLSVQAKLFWPLSAFKNLNFYRLIFTQRKNVEKKQNNPVLNTVSNLIFHSNAHFNNNINKTTIQTKKIKEPYLFIGKTTKHIVPSYSSKSRNNANIESFSLFEQHNWRKKSSYLVAKTKIIQKKSQNRLFWMTKVPFMSNLISTLTIFAKYLDPQPLADHIAAIIGATKRHGSVLKLLETALRMLNFRRGIGYRIALTGRINGAKKTRTFYLAKLKRERPRQTFDKNVNFATTQARATIGAFGVKIWVYS